MTEHISTAELHDLQAQKNGVKRVKGAKRTECNGVWFDSKLEAGRYSELLLLQRAGKIRFLELQVPIVLRGADGPIKTPTGKDMTYRADFRYFDVDLGIEVIEDAKGYETEVFKMKNAILAAQGVNIALVGG